MERKDERVSVFPPEYAYLQSSLNEVEEQISQFDNVIANLPNDKGHTYTFSPPGGKDASPGYDRQSSIKDFNVKKSLLINSFNSYIDKEIVNADPAAISKIKGFVAHRISNNEYKDQSKEQLKEQKSEIKEDSLAFDFMASLHYSKFDTPYTVNEKVVEEVDMTEGFMNMLNYHRNEKNVEKTVSKDDLDKD